MHSHYTATNNKCTHWLCIPPNRTVFSAISQQHSGPLWQQEHPTSIPASHARAVHDWFTNVTEWWCVCWDCWLCVCTCVFWCTSRHSSKWVRVRSTDFRTLLREVLFCLVSPSAMLWYQSGCTVRWRAMNLATVSSIRPPLPHTDTVCGQWEGIFHVKT